MLSARALDQRINRSGLTREAKHGPPDTRPQIPGGHVLPTSNRSWTVIRPGRLIHGQGGTPTTGQAVGVHGANIQWIGPVEAADAPGGRWRPQMVTDAWVGVNPTLHLGRTRRDLLATSGQQAALIAGFGASVNLVHSVSIHRSAMWGKGSMFGPKPLIRL